MEKLVDAFLYLGPPSLALREQAPAQIATDPYGRSLAHTALILDDWRRNELRDMDGAS
jgi:hypothetical protein